LKKIVIGTTNNKKKKELRTLLKGCEIKLLSLSDFKNIPKVVEDGNTFDDNAVKKALVVSGATKILTLADDSGLEVEALGGRPGIFSARFSGNGATDLKNNKKLLRLLKGVPRNKRRAQFRCSIAIAENGSLLKLINEKCKGMIGFERKGKSGFGYDPVFIVPRYGKTFAQLGLRIKNRISHRAKALKKAKKFILKYFEEFP